MTGRAVVVSVNGVDVPRETLEGAEIVLADCRAELHSARVALVEAKTTIRILEQAGAEFRANLSDWLAR